MGRLRVSLGKLAVCPGLLLRGLLFLLLSASLPLFTPAPGHARAAQNEPVGDFGALREGDILFQQSASTQSRAIQWATHSRWSHCGILLKRGKRLMVFEAAARVGYAPLEQWIARGVGGSRLVMRLSEKAFTLTPERLRALRKAAAAFEGKPYDLFFQWSDKAQYCSELVWKVYKNGLGIRLAPLRKMRDFDFSRPEVRATLRRRYGANIPWDQPVIAPSDLAASELLVRVRQ